MGVKFFSAILVASLSLTSSLASIQPAASAVSNTPLPSDAPIEVAIAQEPDLPESDLASLSFPATQWLIALGLIGGAIAIGFGVYRYNQNERWYRIEFLRKTVKEFEQDPDIWKALKILDFEEYRDYEIKNGEDKIVFRVNNELLCRALGTHEDRRIYQKEIDQLQQKVNAAEQGSTVDEETLEGYKKKLRQYHIETGLRDWFNKMLNGLEHFGYFVESGMFTVDEIRPWMIYWIRLIADQEYKRQDASKFYDQLYTYIHRYGFSGVIKLFERFGYRILPTPYKEFDFADLSKGLHEFDLQTALSLAKAANLVYSDLSYIKEICVRRWGIQDLENFKYLNNRERDTQAFMFKTKDYVIIAFRGSQEIQDWRTNARTRFEKFAIATSMEPLDEDTTPPIGQVHRGFQAAWRSVEEGVLKQLEIWGAGRKSNFPIFITGHSLGGALATVAASSLVKRGRKNIQGVYTFGQPRVGDLVFVNEIGRALKGKVFRFVNNNDIVPRVPPPYLPWNPTHIYIHLGTTFYFNAFGGLVKQPGWLYRRFDSLIGFSRAVFKQGLDAINDHRVEFYISNLEKALEIEKERQVLESEEREISSQ
ncbi:lipase family protein [Leptolyngbya sp. FACHB-541]|uniref:lipase family protein n=1 Tax=Leptolyngbya sp. FACHB-541 TaxID=2692810 RepID=UPI001684333A|nr:lipase family protein [Leptolyngbya sp. FACHB-541]MBD1869201.1 lipase family protein [Cyanobacteria bacterium FACHB-471]MBD1996926.1 lipase family protein [Leptolyngbya sp. FACHB-541]